jgi:flagella basal body P-ring formation protein FlgA
MRFFLSLLIIISSLFGDDITCISDEVKKEFLNLYPDATINSLTIYQRQKSEFEFPSKYEIVIKAKHLNREKGVFYIKSSDKKRFFFNFEIDANIPVLKASEFIPRKAYINALNTKALHVKFDKHSARALNHIPSNAIMAKKNIKKDSFINKRDILLAPIVKKDSHVNVILQNDSLIIEFSATATKDARLNEIITFIKSDGKKIKAKVIAPNKAKML